MPQVTVTEDTTEDELIACIGNLFAASHAIDFALASGRLGREQRRIRCAARDSIHDEIERLTDIIRLRRATAAA